MEERLKTYLRPGEQVRWQDRPAPFSLLEAEAKKQILLKWGLTVALGGGLLAVYLSRTEAPSMGFIGLVLLVLGGGGAFAYIKFIRPKQASKVSADPDDYDFADEEEYINEDEPEPEEEMEDTK